jgi:hypothetical protein
VRSACRPSLTAAARAGCWIRRPGRKNAPLGPNQRMEAKGMTADAGAGEAPAGRHANCFPVPVPARCRGGSGKCCGGWAVLSRRSSAGEAIAAVGLDESAFGGEGGEALREGGGTDATALTQLGEGERWFGIGQGCHDARIERGWRRRHVHGLLDDFEREGITALSEFNPHRLCGWRGAMLDAEGEIIAVAAQIEIGVTPGVELGGEPRSA